MRHLKEYTLIDGQKVTIQEVIDRTGVSTGTACQRLKSQDPKQVFARKGAQIGFDYVKKQKNFKKVRDLKLKKTNLPEKVKTYGMSDTEFIRAMRNI
jgi:hypothetical protein